MLFRSRVAEATHWTIPRNYPLVGEDAFRTATGVHAAALIKAQALGHQWLADRVYSGVPAGMFTFSSPSSVGTLTSAPSVACAMLIARSSSTSSPLRRK